MVFVKEKTVVLSLKFTMLAFTQSGYIVTGENKKIMKYLLSIDKSN